MADNRRPPFSLTQSSSIALGIKRGFVASNTTITTTNNGGILSQNSREVVTKKPRGRPKGSKNKPKPPVFIKESTETLLESILIEIPSGRDIVEPLIKLALSRQARIIVLSGSGLISEVNFLHPVTRTSGNQGKVFGGVVGGRVIAAGTVLISAALVKNPTFDRLGINADRNQH
ncbi:AT-hook motif nuclear-localized protein 17 isoform X1 [Lathyrus oleraceus]|uniref:AT-hook motif nuclear-localized protein 17 isoform X1 n=1 Tax=Pisum sativum TaxID=3888 RepID=UPI001FC4743A|nr:AT-hook motif nuclear-localized protein 17-like isoform X1 [Pisum sativum]